MRSLKPSMSIRSGEFNCRAKAIGFLGLGVGCLILAPACYAANAPSSSDTNRATYMIFPKLEPERGRQLFVTKGCVLCHSVNGVGGVAAPSLDAPKDYKPIDVMNFVARMWSGAPAMTSLQAQELGYTITLDGTEIADLAAFSYDRKSQQVFTIENIPEDMRNKFIDELYWQNNSWDKYLSQSKGSK